MADKITHTIEDTPKKSRPQEDPKNSEQSICNT